MQAIALYFLKSVFISGALILYYRIALRNTLLHQYNRFYLLLSVIISLLLPALQLDWFVWQSSNPQTIALMQVIETGGGEKEQLTHNANILNLPLLTVILFVCISVALLLVLAYRVHKIYRLRQRYPNFRMEEFQFINTDLSQAPFSFLDNLFWRNDIDLQCVTGQQILQHELTHIRQKHTWDKLLMQVVVSVCWINPFYWLLRRELYLVHEFIADENAVKDKDAAAFAAMLLSSRFGSSIFAPAQSLGYSPIKRRLYMLTNSKQPRYHYMRRLMALPVLGLLVILFAFKLEKSHERNASVRSAKQFTLVVDAGHGGKDAGAFGLNEAQEKDLNLMLAKKVKALSGEYGIDVILTRDKDDYSSPADRVQFANKIKADGFLSIHINAADVSNVTQATSGIEVFVSDKNVAFDKSKLLGSAVVNKLEDGFSVNKNLQQSKTNIMVLKSADMPAILIECGYITNEQDMAILSDDAKTTLLAKRILEGVAVYANNAGTAAVLPANDSVPAKPLVIIDGVIKTEAALNALPQENIQSITVLKGKDATDKYGENGKAGVIEVTMKAASTQGFSISAPKPAPLYLVDGEEVKQEAVNKINPVQIESVQVWKGEVATKKFGIKAANGVVEITTKKVVAGKSA